MDHEDIDPRAGDHDPRKARQVERYLTGSDRFERKKKHLAEKKARGGRRERRRHGDDDQEDDGSWRDEVPARHGGPVAKGPRPRPDAAPAAEARVASVARTEVLLLDGAGAVTRGRASPAVRAQGGLVVGDDVLVDDQGRVLERLPRRSLLRRRAPGGRGQKLIAANVDVGLVVVAPREDGVSLGLIDRSVAALSEGRVGAAIVVTKADLLAPDARSAIEASLAPWARGGVPVHAVSSVSGEGVGAVRDLVLGRVAVVLGHSGVGKSTLVNALDPAADQLTGDVREQDGRGRHTTTSSRLLPFAGGALVDTPGLRELAPVVEDPAALMATIPELGPLVGRCRYSDCAHAGEPGCAVIEAAEADASIGAALARFRRLVASLAEPS